MAGVGPVTGLEQHGFQQPDLDYLTGHTVDFNPVAHANSIPSHQDEPPEERNDEILHRNGESGARKSQHSGRLVGHSENHDDRCESRESFHGGSPSCCLARVPELKSLS